MSPNLYVLTALHESDPINVIAAFKSLPTFDAFKEAMQSTDVSEFENLLDWYDGLISDGEVWDENCIIGLALSSAPFIEN